MPVGVAVAPVIPGLTDHEMPAILKAAAEAGARATFYTILRLPLGVADLFSEWLDRHAPLAKEKVLGRLKGMRGGRLNDARFGHRMGGDGAHADLIRTMFRTSRRSRRAGQAIPRALDGGFPPTRTGAALALRLTVNLVSARPSLYRVGRRRPVALETDRG